jgi:hypothetical protein
MNYNLSRNEQQFQTGISQFKALGYENSISTQRHISVKNVKEKQMNEKKAVLPESLEPHETPIMAIFGGCAMDNYGFCAPVVHTLVRISHWVHNVEDDDMSLKSSKHTQFESEKATQERYFAKLSPQKSVAVSEDDTIYSTHSKSTAKTLNTFTKTDVYGKSGKLPDNFADFKMSLAQSIHEKRSTTILDSPLRAQLAHSKSIRGLSSSMSTNSSFAGFDSSSFGKPQSRVMSSQKTKEDMNFDPKREHMKRVRGLSREIFPSIVGTDKANRYSYADKQEQYLRSLPPPMLLNGSQRPSRTSTFSASSTYDPVTSLSGQLPRRIHSSSGGR